VVPEAAAASYVSGRGGVVLEYYYGATLLAILLTGDRLPKLGDDVTPSAILFQASAVSASGWRPASWPTRDVRHYLGWRNRQV
jgi:hypothetical protein